MAENKLLAARLLIQAVGCALSVTKNSYVVLINDLACDLQAVHQGAEATIETLEEQDAKSSALDLRFQLLAEGDAVAGDLRERLNAKLEELE